MRQMNLPAIKLQTKYRLWRELGICLNILVYFGLGGTFFSLGQGNSERALLFAVMLIIAYYISERVGWATSKIQMEIVIKECRE